jgi:hypothetical protein
MRTTLVLSYFFLFYTDDYFLSFISLSFYLLLHPSTASQTVFVFLACFKTFMYNCMDILLHSSDVSLGFLVSLPFLYLIGLLAKIKCNTCSNQCENWFPDFCRVFFTFIFGHPGGRLAC